MKEVLLKDICNITMGQSPKSEFYRSEEVGRPFLQGCATFGDFYPNIDTWTVNWNKEAEYNDILFTVRAPVGNINYAPCKVAIGRGIAALHPIHVDREYLFYLLKYTKSKFISMSNGSVYDAINIDTLSNIKLLIYDDEIQKKISKILSNYDKLIQNNNRRIKLLETMAEELYKEWFVRFRFPGYKKVKFENGIPEGWEIEKIKKCSKILVGGDAPDNITDKPSGNNIYPVYSNGIDKDGLYGYTDKYRIDKLSITISARGTIGYTSLRKANYTPIVRLVVLIPNNDIDVYYCYQALKYVDLSGNGTSQQQLTIPMIEKRKILIPNILLMNKYGNICKCLYDEIDMLKIKNEILVKQRDYLLPRLMSGKISVENKNII